MKKRNSKTNVNKTQKVKGIQQRMLSSYYVVIVISVISSILALGMLGYMGRQFKVFYEGNYRVTVETWNVRYAELSARSALLSAMVDEDLSVTDEQMKIATNHLEEMGALLNGMKESYSGDVSVIDTIDQNRQEALLVVDEMLEYTAFAQYEKAHAIMKESYEPKVDQIAKLLEQIAVEEDASALKKVEMVNTLMLLMIGIVVVVIIISNMVAIKLGTKIAKGISEPVKEIEGAAKQLSEGNLDVQISYHSADELGRLADSMRESCSFMKEVVTDADNLLYEIAGGNFKAQTSKENVYIGDFQGLLVSISRLKEQLSNTLIEINEASVQVSLGAEQLASGAQSLAEGAVDQAGAVEELNAMVNGVNDASQVTVGITNDSYKQATEFKKEVEAGQQEMSNLLTAMERIKETSNNIEKIIVEIEDIASQTNLLSLNASIEAARAGEAGRGFAVVADQVGKLAADCAQSSVNTKKLIQQAIEEVESGNEIAYRTSETLERVADGIEMLASSVNEVNIKATDQAEAINQVELGIEQISTVIENNSAAAEETSATSEELSAQAERLKGLVGQFVL